MTMKSEQQQCVVDGNIFRNNGYSNTHDNEHLSAGSPFIGNIKKLETFKQT